jgi:hypothetical protein
MLTCTETSHFASLSLRSSLFHLLLVRQLRRLLPALKYHGLHQKSESMKTPGKLLYMLTSQKRATGRLSARGEARSFALSCHVPTF